MKKRVGFVSNSSSSSFVMIVTKEGHEKALENLNVYQRDMMNAAMREIEVFGNKVFVFTESVVMDYSMLWNHLTIPWKDEYEEFEDDGYSTAFYAYREHLPKECVIFEWEEDF